jgi:hypothetical protein
MSMKLKTVGMWLNGIAIVASALLGASAYEMGRIPGDDVSIVMLVIVFVFIINFFLWVNTRPNTLGRKNLVSLWLERKRLLMENEIASLKKMKQPEKPLPVISRRIRFEDGTSMRVVGPVPESGLSEEQSPSQNRTD